MIYFSKNIYILLFLYFGISGAEAAGGFNQTDFTFAGAPKADKDMQIFDILQKLGNGLITSGRAISGIVIAVSGMMWILGANTNLFSSILKFAIGVSIITNIAWFVNSGYFFDLSGFFGTQPAFPSVKDITINLNTSWNFMGVFMVYYERVIIYASSQLMPYSLKLLGFLTILEMVSVLMFKQNGDHFHYLVHSVIKTGVFLFLLANWINGSTSIANSIFIFFEDMGIIATDFPGQVSAIGLGDENIILLIACFSGCYTIVMLAIKAPALVSGLLNGSPQMTRGDLLTPTRQVYGGAKTAVNTMIGAADKAGYVGGTIAAASNQAGGHNAYMAEYRARKAAGAAGVKVLEGSRGALALGNFADDVKAHMRGIGGTLGNLKEYGKTQMPGRRTWNVSQTDYKNDMVKNADIKGMAKQARVVKADGNGNLVSQAWNPEDSSQQESAAQAKQKNVVKEAASNKVNRSEVSNKTQMNVTKENVSTETVTSSESMNKTENIVQQVENKIDHTDRSMK